MSNKLQNIKAVKELLTGAHKSQTRKTSGFTKTKEDTNHLIQNANTWNIVIFNTEDISNLHIPVYTYNEDTISELFDRLKL